MNEPITLKSEAVLAVQLAPFTTANKLVKAVARELALVSFDMELGKVDLSNLQPKDLNTLKNAAFQLLQSDTVETCLFACLERCLYNGQRITRDTFEKPEARADYLPVAWEVMKANLVPFFKNLGFVSSTNEAPKPSDQK